MLRTFLSELIGRLLARIALLGISIGAVAYFMDGPALDTISESFSETFAGGAPASTPPQLQLPGGIDLSALLGAATGAVSATPPPTQPIDPEQVLRARFPELARPAPAPAAILTAEARVLDVTDGCRLIGQSGGRTTRTQVMDCDRARLLMNSTSFGGHRIETVRELRYLYSLPDGVQTYEGRFQAVDGGFERISIGDRIKVRIDRAAPGEARPI